MGMENGTIIGQVLLEFKMCCFTHPQQLVGLFYKTTSLFEELFYSRGIGRGIEIFSLLSLRPIDSFRMRMN